ncbi:ribbon-helix-helix protein, CopG family [Cerasicoccus fimbriatus]|uniref:ribbon-helix-helix protein, CopG family n=1 Tax=Cerasicoccus fimbriatus TaxID=3014554 RepID=UPI0022B451B6|nr:ribbon-helix-helix protein, CopG family [Cerasicoccus sp. TK19100]
MPRKKSSKKPTKKSANKKKAAAIRRAPGKTQISISLPAELVLRIDVLATAQNRNRSNFIATELEKLAE